MSFQFKMQCYFCNLYCWDHKSKAELKRCNKAIQDKNHRKFDSKCKLIKPCSKCSLHRFDRDKHAVCRKCYPYVKDYCGICQGWLSEYDSDVSLNDDDLDLASNKADKIAGESISRKILILKERVISILQYYHIDESPEFLKERQKLLQFTKQLIEAIDLYRKYVRTGYLDDKYNKVILSYFKLQRLTVLNELRIYKVAILEALVGPVIKQRIIGQLNLIDLAINSMDMKYNLYDRTFKCFNIRLIESLEIPLELKQRIIKSKRCFFCQRLYYNHYILEHRLTYLGKRKVKRCRFCVTS